MGKIEDYELIDDISAGTLSTAIALLETDNGTKTMHLSKLFNPYSRTKLDAKFEDAANPYSKEELDAKFEDVTNPYSKEELDEKFEDAANPYSKEELDAKFSETEKFKETTVDELESATNYQTIYRSGIYNVHGVGYSKVTILVASDDTNHSTQIGIVPGYGLLVIRRKSSASGTFGSWSVIGTTDNIEDGAISTLKIAKGAVTLPKIGTDVIETGSVNELINEGESSSRYTASGKYLLSGGMCTITVHVKCTPSHTANSFSLPVAVLSGAHYGYAYVSVWAGSLGAAMRSFSIKADGTTCYIRASDDGLLAQANVDFTLTYPYL